MIYVEEALEDIVTCGEMGFEEGTMALLRIEVRSQEVLWRVERCFCRKAKEETEDGRGQIQEEKPMETLGVSIDSYRKLIHELGKIEKWTRKRRERGERRKLRKEEKSRKEAVQMEQLLQNQSEGAGTGIAVTEHNKGVESNLETNVNKETKRMSEANNKEETKIERWTRKRSERDGRRKLRKEEKSRKANEKANPSLYLDFALAYKKIGDLDSYRDILEAGVDIPVPHCDVSDVAVINQFWPITWCCKGVMFLQKFELDGSADSQKTLDHYFMAAKKEGDSLPCHLGLGAVNYLDGKYKDSAGNYARAMSLFPEESGAPARVALGLACYKLGQIDRAKACFDRAIEMDAGLTEGVVGRVNGQVLNFLGVTTGLIQGGMAEDERRKQYDNDVVWVSNQEIGFDYLRDHLSMTKEGVVLGDDRVERFCLVDEADSIFIDEEEAVRQ
ncbi:hypothetical protein TrCOL_g9839 [Triparma columacea]|uniref:SecA family profile domain-containing protein n=1 Tax=Triparma columacea TaxID=722753 RepID=A0A9W7L222_9STRA|nr:hypothetical protein TrCOL_g9839 [Triparma columacea]